MLIDNKMLEQSLELSLPDKVEFQNLGLVDHALPEMLTFVEGSRYIPLLSRNANIKGVFVSPELADQVPAQSIRPIVCDDPRHCFYTLYNFRAKAAYRRTPSRIDASAVISRGAHVSDYNVTIGANTLVEPGAVILPDVELGRDCVVGPGAVVGCDDAEIKRTSRGLFRIVHDGALRIGDRVEIGAHCTVDKGFSFQDTIIGDDTKLANRTYIGHSVQIGKRCALLCCTVLGSAVVEDDARINPGAIVSNQVRIGRGATVTMGAVVFDPVPAGGRVSGNFAVDHQKFLYFWTKNFASRGSSNER